MSSFRFAFLGYAILPALASYSAHAGELAPQGSATQFSDPYASPTPSGVLPAARPRMKAPPEPSGGRSHDATIEGQGSDGKVGLGGSTSVVTNKTVPDLQRNANPDAAKPSPSDLPVGLDLRWSAANDPYHSPYSTTEAIDAVRRNQNQTPSSPGNALDMGVKLNF
jgi:hypothetical protein